MTSKFYCDCLNIQAVTGGGGGGVQIPSTPSPVWKDKKKAWSE